MSGRPWANEGDGTSKDAATANFVVTREAKRTREAGLVARLRRDRTQCSEALEPYLGCNFLQPAVLGMTMAIMEDPVIRPEG